MQKPSLLLPQFSTNKLFVCFFTCPVSCYREKPAKDGHRNTGWCKKNQKKTERRQRLTPSPPLSPQRVPDCLHSREGTKEVREEKREGGREGLADLFLNTAEREKAPPLTGDQGRGN